MERDAAENLSMTRRPHPKPKTRRRIFLQEWRKYRGLTQEQLAERVGMSKGNISQLEANRQGYSQEGLEALADALQCEPGQLLSVDPTKDDAMWSIWERAGTGQKAEIVSHAQYVLEKGRKTGS